MKQREQAWLFLRKAAEDEAPLDAVLNVPSVADSTLGFHCQQAAEKLLKALACSMGLRLPKTHDLQELMDMLEASGRKLPAELCCVDEFAPFAVEFRYEDMTAEEAWDRARARKLVRQLRAYVEKEIGAAPA